MVKSLYYPQELAASVVPRRHRRRRAGSASYLRRTGDSPRAMSGDHVRGALTSTHKDRRRRAVSLVAKILGNRGVTPGDGHSHLHASPAPDRTIHCIVVSL